MNQKETILIAGACGQIGVELAAELRELYGIDNVIATDIKEPHYELKNSGPFERLDILDKEQFTTIVNKYKVSQIYHLAATLSATAEKDPLFAWKLNMGSLLLVLEAAKEFNFSKIFWPSSIGVFGPSSPKQNTPQTTIMDPDTVYGLSKLAGERWCDYYYHKHGIDIRSVRYPGLISYKSKPGGGTTDYAVEIFYELGKNNEYECFIAEDTGLPMMYMPDATRAAIELMEADPQQLNIHSSYNLAGCSFSPREITLEIQKHFPDFKVTYSPDYRQYIAESWPESIDDSIARNEWGWQPSYDLTAMVDDMLANINVNDPSSV